MGFKASEDNIPMVPACGEGIPEIYKIKQIDRPPIPDARAPVLVAFFMNKPQTNGPRKNAPMAPQEIPNMATMVSTLRKARVTDNMIKNALANLISRVKVPSLAFLLIKPWYRSLVSDELEINTRAARVDMDAERIRSKIMTDNDSGITLARSSGIKRSKIGFPRSNASGLDSGVRNTLVVDPMK